MEPSVCCEVELIEYGLQLFISFALETRVRCARFCLCYTSWRIWRISFFNHLRIDAEDERSEPNLRELQISNGHGFIRVWKSHLCSRLRNMYTVSQKKTRHSTHVDKFVKYWSIFKILSLLDYAQNFLQKWVLYISPYLKDVAALPCETIVFQKSHKFQNIVHVCTN